MSNYQNLFAAFPSVDKETQINKIIKDLKGRSYQELIWPITSDLQLDPINHKEDLDQLASPLKGNRKNNDWEIGSSLLVDPSASVNQLAIGALKNGAQALRFKLQTDLTPPAFLEYLNGIELNYISTILEGAAVYNHPISWIDTLTQKANSNNLQLSLAIDWLESDLDYQDHLLKLSKAYSADFPHLRWISIDTTAQFKGPESVVEELASALFKGKSYLDFMTEAGYSTSQISQRMQVQFHTSTSFFVEICKYRAFQLLWGNLTAAYDHPSAVLPLLEAQANFAPALEDQNSKLIQATTQTAAAIIGGVQRFYAWSDENEDPFYARLGRNLQHILKVESFLDRTIDPGAGSYYIETATEKIAQAAWNLFQQKVAKG